MGHRTVNYEATRLFVLMEESQLLVVRIKALRLFNKKVYKKASERAQRRSKAFWSHLNTKQLPLTVVGSKRDLGWKYINYEPIEEVRKRYVNAVFPQNHIK